MLVRDGGARLTNDVDFCGGSTALAGQCNLIADSDATDAHSAAMLDSRAGLVPLFDGLVAAGSYSLGIYYSNTPNPGCAAFRVAEAPALAPALLLVSASGPGGWGGVAPADLPHGEGLDRPESRRIA